MIELYKAELQKIVGNKYPIGFLLWSFPIGAAVLYLTLAALIVFVPDAKESLGNTIPARWSDTALSVWKVPTNLLGRMFLIGLISIIFNGEYQWGTWKNVVVRASRTKLLATKLLVTVVLILFAFSLMSLITALGVVGISLALGREIMPAFSPATFSSFFQDYLIQMALSFVTVLISAGLVTLFSMRMRSILGGVMAGLGITLADPLIFGGFLGMSVLLKMPAILFLGRLTPFYNIENATAWITRNSPSMMSLAADNRYGAAYVFSDPLSFSLIVLAVWAVGLSWLILYLFNRQDITS